MNKRFFIMMCLSLLIGLSAWADEPYTEFEYNGTVVINGLKFAVTLPEDGKGEALLMGVDDASNARVATRGIMDPKMALELKLKFKESDVTRVSGGHLGRPTLPPNTDWIGEARKRPTQQSSVANVMNVRAADVDPDKEYTCELKVIGYSALQGTEITELTIPEGVTTIWGSAIWPVNKVEGIGFNTGDIVTLIGTRIKTEDSDYMNVKSTILTHKVTEISLADFLTKEDSKDVYYKVTGVVDEIRILSNLCNLYMS